MGLIDYFNYFESKNKQTKESKQTGRDVDYGFAYDTIEYGNLTFKIDKDKMSENYFEPIYYNDQLMEIITVEKPCKQNNRTYLHYRNFDDYVNNKHYARDFVSTFTRDMGDIIVKHTHTRSSVQQNELDEVTGDEILNITRESVKHESENIVTYKGNKYILKHSNSKTNFYPEHTVFGFTYNMDKYADCILKTVNDSLSDNFGVIYESQSIQRTNHGQKNPEKTLYSNGNKKLYLDIVHFVDKVVEFKNREEFNNSILDEELAD